MVQAVPFGVHLVLNDDRRNAEPFQVLDQVLELVRLTPGVPVDNDGLGRHIEYFVDGVSTGVVTDNGSVGQTLGGRVGQAALPEAVVFDDLAVLLDSRVLGDNPAQATVGLQDADEALPVDSLPQRA